jgi:hypothetical protein
MAVVTIAASIVLSSLAHAQNIQRETTANAFLQPVTEKQKVHKLNLYDFSRMYEAVAITVDSKSTFAALDHPTVALGTGGTVLGRYHVSEVGPAGYFSKSNPLVAVGVGIALDFALDRVTRRMKRHGGHWQTAATWLNAAQATDNLACGVYNFIALGRIDGQVRQATGYNGPISWPRH